MRASTQDDQFGPSFEAYIRSTLEGKGTQIDQRRALYTRLSKE